MNHTLLALLIWTVTWSSLAAQNYESKANDHFREKNFREAMILYDLELRAKGRLEAGDTFGKAIFSAFSYGDTTRFTYFSQKAENNGFSDDFIIGITAAAALTSGNENAMKEIGQLWLQDPNTSHQKLQSLTSYFRSHRRYDDALYFKQQQIERFKPSVNDQVELANLQLACNHRSEALNIYRQVITLDQDNYIANLALGFEHFRLGIERYDKFYQPWQYANQRKKMNRVEQINRTQGLRNIFNHFLDSAQIRLEYASEYRNNEMIQSCLKEIAKRRKQVVLLEIKIKKSFAKK